MTGFRKAAIHAVLWSAAIGCALATSSSVALGVDEQAGDERCAAVWQAVAVDRADGYLSDREAAPYLAVLRAGAQPLASDNGISRAEFIAACRSGAISLAVLPARPGTPDVPVGTTRRMICEMPDD